MSTLQTALRGCGRGVMALLAGIWARYLACLSEWTLPNTKTKWVVFVVNLLPLGVMIHFATELVPIWAIGYLIAFALDHFLVWPVLNSALVALVRRLQGFPSNLLLHGALAALLVAIPLVVVTTSVSAHPPSDQNHEQIRYLTRITIRR